MGDDRRGVNKGQRVFITHAEPRVAPVQKVAAQIRADGNEVSGCSFCVRHPAARPKTPCPFCGAEMEVSRG